MTLPSGKPRVALYARYSTDKQSPRSIEDQFRELAVWVERNIPNADVTRYSDAATSGSLLHRPGWDQIREAITRRTIDVVVAENIDRVSRNAADSMALLDLAAFHGIRLVMVTNGIDTGTDTGSSPVNFGFSALMSQEFLKGLADKTRRGLTGRASVGAATGPAPYGYTISRKDDRATYEIDVMQAGVVRRIFGEWTAGQSLGSIARRLNDDRIDPPRAHSRRRGDGWMLSAVRSMLMNEKYAGRWCFGSTKMAKDPETRRRVAQRRPTGPLVIRDAPDLALVDSDTWDAAQARFAANKYQTARPARRRHPLSGVLVCARCGSPMTVSGGNESTSYYGCARARARGLCDGVGNVPTSILVDAVLGTIETTLARSAETVRRIVAEEIESFRTQGGGHLERLDAEIRAAESAIDNCARTLERGWSEAMSERLAANEAKRDRLRRERAEWQKEAPTIPDAAEVAARVLALRALRDADPDLVREQLRALTGGPGITIDRPAPGEWVVRWSLLAAPLILGAAKSKTPTGSTPVGVSGGVYTPVVAGARTDRCVTSRCCGGSGCWRRNPASQVGGARPSVGA